MLSDSFSIFRKNENFRNIERSIEFNDYSKSVKGTD